MKDKLKLGIVAVVSLIGTLLIIERRSYATIITGAVMVGVAGPMVYYFIAKLKNHKDTPEVDALAKVGQQLLDRQDEEPKDGRN